MPPVNDNVSTALNNEFGPAVRTSVDDTDWPGPVATACVGGAAQTGGARTTSDRRAAREQRARCIRSPPGDECARAVGHSRRPTPPPALASGVQVLSGCAARA